MDRDARSIDFTLRIGIPQYPINDRARGQLHLIFVILQVGKPQVGIGRQAHNIAVIEFDLGARSV
jgi:hypothetical protein